MTKIALLSTDFDGTLVDWIGPRTFPDALAQRIEDLRSRGLIWAINTGRTLEMTLEGLAEARYPGLPDFILASEREIYRRDPGHAGGWSDLDGWNVRAAAALDALHETAAEEFAEVQRQIGEGGLGRIVVEDGRTAGLVAPDNPAMDRIVEFLETLRLRRPVFNFQRNSIYLRFCHSDYSKGATLGAVAQALGIPRDSVLAVGDHFNDLSMLDGRAAGMVACPGNAVPEVVRTVQRAGGLAARRHCGDGVLEAIDFYERRANPAPQ